MLRSYWTELERGRRIAAQDVMEGRAKQVVAADETGKEPVGDEGAGGG
jgi:hypothetical protein